VLHDALCIYQQDIQDAFITCLPSNHSHPASPAFDNEVYINEPNSATTSPNNNSIGNNQQQQYPNWCMKDSNNEHSPAHAGETNVTPSLQYHHEEQQEQHEHKDDILMCPTSPPLIPNCCPYVLENGPNDFNWLPQTDIEAAAQILALERETLSLQPTEYINNIQRQIDTNSASTSSTTATRRLCTDTSPFTSPNAQSSTTNSKKKL
jgi:hypothetical protein